ncbi:hypothetical protein CAPTEDRAFT_93704, partial [Capitella teleta]
MLSSNKVLNFVYCHEVCHAKDCRCKPGYFQCEAGGCVPYSKVCDCSEDCSDGSDEECQVKRFFHCSGMFQCLPGVGYCIPYSYVCDGVVDCPEAFDEVGC